MKISHRYAITRRQASRKLRLSALSLAVTAAFAPVWSHADPLSGVIVDGSKDQPQTFGSDVVINEPASIPEGQPARAVSAVNGGQIQLNGTQVQVNSPFEKTWGLYATGAGSSITASGAAIAVDGAGTNGGNAPLGTDAERGATITLQSGSVTMTGANRTIAVRSMSGGTTMVDGTTISTAGANSHAVMAFADDVSAGLAHIDITGGSVTTAGSNSYALYAQNAGAQVDAHGVTVSTTGSNSRGVHAVNGGAVNVDGTTQVTTNGASAQGMLASGTDAASGAQSKIVSTDATVVTNGAGAVGVAAGAFDGASGTLSFTGGSVTTNGALAYGASATYGGTVALADTSVTVNDAGHDNIGLFASGAGSSITASATNVSVVGTGNGSGEPTVGVEAKGGGTIALTGGKIAMTGADRTIGVLGNPGSTITTSNTDISTAGSNSHAVLAWSNDPTQANVIDVNGGHVTTSGTNSYGLYGEYAGSTVNGDNVAVTTTGDIGRGVYAWDGGVVNVNGGTIETAGTAAEGMMSASDQSGQLPRIVANNVLVNTTGAMSSGIAAGAQDGHEESSIDFTAGSINTSGEGSAGVTAQYAGAVGLHNTAVTAAGANAPAAAVIDGGSLNVDASTLSSAHSDGIVITGNGNVTLTGTTVNAAGASLVSNLNSPAVQQNITVGNGSVLTQNNGTLLQVNRTADGMDGVVNLTLQAGSTSSGQIVDSDGLGADGTRAGGGTTNFIVEQGATWSGTAQGLNNASVGDGGTFTHNGGGAIAGDVTAGNSATVTFNDAATVGGSVQSGANSDVSFNNAATIGKDVVSNGANFTFAGNATIGQNVQANAGGSVSFAGAATIASNVSASNATVTFSKTAATQIGGNLSLDDGSSTHGGTTGNPVRIAGNAAVNDGSVLGGNLVVAGSVSGTNGTLAPGNSVGTQTYGSLAGFTGTYVSEVNAAGQSDRIVVQSNADLAGLALRVSQENGNGGFRLNTPYTVLQTTNGGVVQNRFSSAALDASFDNTLVELAPVQYDPTDVKVSLAVDRQKVAAAASGFTKNQNAALFGALSVSTPNAVVDALFTSAVNGGNFDQVSGESYASTKTALIEDSRYVRDAAIDRLRSSFSSAAAPDVQALSFDANGKSVASTLASQRVAVWTKGFGAWGHTSGSDGSSSLSDSTGGVLVGADGLVGDRWRVGGLFGYSHSNFDVDGVSSSAGSDNYHVGLYGGTQFGNVGVRAGAAYSWQNIDSSRSIAFANFTDHTNASYDAGTAQAFGEVAYTLNVGRAALEPFANLAYVSLHTDAFDESGGDAALHSDGDTTNTAFSTLGVRASSDFAIGSAAMTVRGTLGWQHAFGPHSPTASVAFAGGQAFDVAGVSIARDAALVGVGVNAAVTAKLSLGVSYSGQIGGGTEDHSFIANLDYRF
ncbi:autotransporter outer membrane beta-barrel domain-containing protein [Paraburkholderia sp. 2C]